MQTIDSYTVARSYVRDFDNIKNNRKNSVIFMGSLGGGKTHLSLVIANELMKRGVDVVYMGYRDCIIRLKQNIMDANVYESMMSRYKGCKVLLIDDLFKGSITSSDKRREELIKIDEAIGSRILERCGDYSVELKGHRLNYRIYG